MRMVDDPTVANMDVFNTVYNLRRQRKHMVQTSGQYTYIYRCVSEYIRRRQRMFGLDRLPQPHTT